ncbi:alkaline phosphatase [Bergeyella sp. RCAD1439]|uniref:alkaline phosphatase n=1 Tax=Bergeyella anatis TaxID=3113737 RepID=UPI002E19DA45|nr:alkaline phosphatase [Bergeyella sp. RCAD1439]
MFIADGVSLPQLYAAYTANGGRLNIFNMPYSGVSNTSSFDAYITDSAPGSTAFSSGKKTRNAYVGVDESGNALRLLPALLADRGKQTALLTSGDVTDATPADFYVHATDRNDSGKIIRFFKDSGVRYLVGGPSEGWQPSMKSFFQSEGVSVYEGLDFWEPDGRKTLVMYALASETVLGRRGDWMRRAYTKLLDAIRKNDKGFFFVVEASRTDIGGHWRDLPYLVSELQEMDNLVGEALRFSDQDGETLVVVVGDHETGGLTLFGGDFQKKQVFGQFSTMDHTALPALVFAYGPGAEEFTGFYENTAVFHKLLKGMGFLINENEK